MKQLTIIIPAYNEETNIRPFYDEACKYLTNPEYEFKLLFSMMDLVMIHLPR
jgi:glycosyltransferase involved in cell wall biosynthesis